MTIVELLACVLFCRQAYAEEYRSLLNDPKQTQLREDSVDGGPGKKKNTNPKMHTSEFGMCAHYKPPMVPSNHLPKYTKNRNVDGASKVVGLVQIPPPACSSVAPAAPV
jgi:hypothetical protein